MTQRKECKRHSQIELLKKKGKVVKLKFNDFVVYRYDAAGFSCFPLRHRICGIEYTPLNINGEFERRERK